MSSKSFAKVVYAQVDFAQVVFAQVVFSIDSAHTVPFKPALHLFALAPVLKSRICPEFF